MPGPLPYSGLSGQAPSPGTVGAPDDYQRVQANPEDFGAGVARAIQGPLTGGIQEAGQAAAQDLQFHNQIAADDATNQNMQNGRNLLFGDPNDPNSKGFFAMQGKEALDAYPTVAAQMEAQRAAISATLTPMQKLQFDTDSRRYNMMMMERVGSHAVDQQRVWNDQTANAGVQNHLQDASLFPNDDVMWKASVGSAIDVRTRYLQSTGASDDVIRADTAKIQSEAYQNRILQTGETNPAAAQAMLEQNKQFLSPGTYVQLEEHLKPKINSGLGKSIGGAIFSSLMGGGDIADAIHMQESGGGADTSTSVTGARGGWQIQPATFQQYAQPGESIDNPKDNEAVGRRIIADLSQKTGGDPARVAVGYFSGAGNIAPAGSATPWIEDRADPTGKTVSSYVQDVLGRMGTQAPKPGGIVFPDEATGVKKIIDQTEGMPEDVRNAALSEYQKNTGLYKLATSTQQQEVSKQFNDAVGALEAGKDDVTIPATTIRSLFPQAQADQMIQRLGVARQAGQMMAGMEYATPADVASARADLATGLGTRSEQIRRNMGSTAPTDLSSETPDQFNMRQQMLARFDALAQQRQAALSANPAGYAAGIPTVASALTAYEQAQPDQKGAAFDAYAQATIAAQKHMGVADQDTRVLATGQSGAIAKQLLSADPSKVDVGGQLDAISQQYGQSWPAVWHDLVRDGHMPPEWQVLATLPAGADRMQLQSALQFVRDKGGIEKLRQDIGSTQAQGVETALDSALDGLRKSMMVPGMPGNPELFTATLSAFRTAGMYAALSGQDGGMAVNKAVDALPYDYIPQNAGLFRDRASFNARAPKGQGAAVESYAAAQLQGLTQQDLGVVKTANPDVTMEQGNAAYLSALKRVGVWVTNERDDGWTLAMPYGKSGYQAVVKPDGSRIGFKFSDMPKATASTPTPDLPAAPMFSGGS